MLLLTYGGGLEARAWHKHFLALFVVDVADVIKMHKFAIHPCTYVGTGGVVFRLTGNLLQFTVQVTTLWYHRATSREQG